MWKVEPGIPGSTRADALVAAATRGKIALRLALPTPAGGADPQHPNEKHVYAEGDDSIKILLFGHHQEVLDALGSKLIEKRKAYGPIVRIDGKTPNDARQAMVNKFQNEKAVRLFEKAARMYSDLPGIDEECAAARARGGAGARRDPPCQRAPRVTLSRGEAEG